jgi:protein-tyrosine-phosphatase
VKRTFSILFVCTGNTCRSPLAERILKARIKEQGWRNFRVASAGTGAVEGEPASGSSKRAARKIGVSLAGFRSKPVTASRVARADLILTMTYAHKHDIEMRWPEAAGKTHAISDYTGSGRGSIIDPIGGPDKVYEACAADLWDEIRRLIPRVTRAMEERDAGGGAEG